MNIDRDQANTTMREDDCFLSIASADLESFHSRYAFSAKNIDSLNKCGILIFPALDCRHRKIIHSLISQRFTTLAHASIGVEPDRHPVAIARDYLLKIIMPYRLKSIDKDSSLTFSEFNFCLALLETCRESSDAKRFIEKLYALKLADQRIASKGLLPSRQPAQPSQNISETALSAKKRIKPGCERYIPRPMRMLQEKEELRKMNKVSSPSSTESNDSQNSLENDVSKLSTSLNIVSISISRGHVKNSTDIYGDKFDSSPTWLQFFENFAGTSSTSIVNLPDERYSSYIPEAPPLDYDALPHVLEVSGFPKDWRGAHLQRYLPIATFIHWVDDTHVLAVFKSGAEAKAFTVPPEVSISLEVCQMKNASIQSKCKAYRIFEDLIARLHKPQTSSIVVRRVLNHHLRLGHPPRTKPTSTALSRIASQSESGTVATVTPTLVSEVGSDS